MDPINVPCFQEFSMPRDRRLDVRVVFGPDSGFAGGSWPKVAAIVRPVALLVEIVWKKTTIRSTRLIFRGFTGLHQNQNNYDFRKKRKISFLRKNLDTKWFWKMWECKKGRFQRSGQKLRDGLYGRPGTVGHLTPILYALWSRAKKVTTVNCAELVLCL